MGRLEGECLLILEGGPERQESQEDPYRNKRTVRHLFPPLPPSTNTVPLVGASMAPVFPTWLAYTKLAPHDASEDPHFPVMFASVLVLQGSYLRSSTKLANTLTSHLQFWHGLSSSGSCSRSHFVSRPAQILLKCTPLSQGTNTAHNRQREPLQTTGLKGKDARTKQ